MSYPTLKTFFYQFFYLPQSQINQTFVFFFTEANKFQGYNFEMEENRPTSDTIKLYEQIVVKNLQVLRSILPKMNSLYQLNQQLERCVNSIETRLTKIESDQENLHYQMRTSHLAFDSKLSTLISDYNNIATQTSKVRKQTENITRELRDSKSRQNIDKNSKDNAISRLDLPAQQKIQKNSRTKRIFFTQARRQQDVQKHIQPKPKLILQSKRSSISVENDDDQENGSNHKVRFKIKLESQGNQSQVSISHFERGLRKAESFSHSRKANLKSSKVVSKAQPIKSLNNITNILKDQPNNKSFQKFLKQIQNYHFHNQKMKQGYEQLMAEYCKNNQTNFRQINEKIQQINERINQINIESIVEVSLSKAKTTLSGYFSNEIQAIKNRMSMMLDKKLFQKMMSDFNHRFIGVYQQRKKMANRDQTKRALQFLEKKINGILSQYYQNKQKSLHLLEVDNNGCLRAAPSKNDQPVTQNQNSLNINIPRIERISKRGNNSQRHTSSLHSKILNGTMTQNRFNQNSKKWRQLSTEKPLDDQSKQISNRNNSSQLKKRTVEILEKEKIRRIPRAKKQKLIFEYD